MENFKDSCWFVFVLRLSSSRPCKAIKPYKFICKFINKSIYQHYFQLGCLLRDMTLRQWKKRAVLASCRGRIFCLGVNIYQKFDQDKYCFRGIVWKMFRMLIPIGILWFLSLSLTKLFGSYILGLPGFVLCRIVLIESVFGIMLLAQYEWCL